MQFNNNLLSSLLFVFIGIFIVIRALYKTKKEKDLESRGEEAEGIIFDKENVNVQFGSSIKQNQTTIRFVTKKQEWITGKMQQAFQLFYTGQYKKGEKVTVIYDPLNPQNFIVRSKQANNKTIFMIGGIVVIGIGIYRLFFLK